MINEAEAVTMLDDLMREIPSVIRTATQQALTKVLAGLNDMLQGDGYTEEGMAALCSEAIEGEVERFNGLAQSYWDLH